MRIVLARHGRSAHMHTGRLNAEEFRRWREAYEAAGIVAEEAPPAAVRDMAGGAVVVASDAARAVQSAELLAAGRPVRISPLLRELDLLPPNLPWRLPLFVWAAAFGIRIVARWALRHPNVTPAEAKRARAAAEWLSQLARTHGTVVAVTHASVRRVIAQAL